jgi:hypothetical protein
VLGLIAAVAALLAGQPAAAAVFALAALAALALVWSKWRFSPFKLPVVVLVPWVMVRSWLWGWVRRAAVLEPHVPPRRRRAERSPRGALASGTRGAA